VITDPARPKHLVMPLLVGANVSEEPATPTLRVEGEGKVYRT
jgi:hypothetical protein